MEQQAWVLRCPLCHGGRMYFVEDGDTEALLDTIIGAACQPDFLWALVEHGPVERIWEIDYCTCEPSFPCRPFAPPS